jgi:hypothetical protein
MCAVSRRHSGFMPESIPVLRYSFGFRDKPKMTGSAAIANDF